MTSTSFDKSKTAHVVDDKKTDPPQVSRREMLKTVGCIFEGLVLTAPMLVDPLRKSNATNVDTPKEQRIKDELQTIKEEKPQHIHTDQEIILRNGCKVHIVGVQHLEAYNLMKDPKMIEYIKNASAVLTESETAVSEIQHTRFNVGYFSDLRRLTLSENKELVDIDVKSGMGLSMFNHVTTATAAFSGLGIAATSIVPKLQNAFLPIRNFLRVLGYSAATLTFPSLPASVNHLTDKKYAKLDLSPTLDGRTVFMLDAVYHYTAQHPNTRIVVITGDEHSKGMLLYHDNPRLFNAKRAFYEKCYQEKLGILRGAERVVSVESRPASEPIKLPRIK
jgi:uncharacterized protein YwlG (UPF0340 family)